MSFEEFPTEETEVSFEERITNVSDRMNDYANSLDRWGKEPSYAAMPPARALGELKAEIDKVDGKQATDKQKPVLNWALEIGTRRKGVPSHEVRDASKKLRATLETKTEE